MLAAFLRIDDDRVEQVGQPVVLPQFDPLGVDQDRHLDLVGRGPHEEMAVTMESMQAYFPAPVAPEIRKCRHFGQVRHDGTPAMSRPTAT